MSDEFTPTPKQREKAAEQLRAVVRAAEALDYDEILNTLDVDSHSVDSFSEARVRITCSRALDLYRATVVAEWTQRFMTAEAYALVDRLWLHSQMVVGLLTWTNPSGSDAIPDEIVSNLGSVFRDEGYERVKEMRKMVAELRPMVAAFAAGPDTAPTAPTQEVNHV